jgi:hypothetical protein
MGLIDSKDRLKLYLTSFFWTLIVPYFVKHELKGVLKYIGVKLAPSPQTVTDIAAKSNSTVGILRKTIDLKIPAFDLFLGTPVTCSDKHLSLPMHINSM